MERLPNELHCEIFSHLNFEDLGEIRLTCKTFADQAAPRVLGHVATCIQKDSLEILHRFSTIETVRHHVKSLRIDIYLLPIDASSTDPHFNSAWECLAHECCCFPFIRSNPCGQKFRAAILEQQEFEKSGDAVNLLATAFRQFPNLKEIEISNRGKLPSGTAFQYVYNSYRHTERHLEHGRLQVEYFIRAAAAETSDEGSKFQPNKFVLWDEGVKPALHKTTIRLLSSDIPLAKIAFKNIKHFVWQQHEHTFRDSQHPHDSRCSIAQFLNSMESLEKFEYSEPGIAQPSWPHTLIHIILLEVHWTKLQTFHFPTWRFGIEMFMSFAMRHAGTLKSLTFDQVHIHGCSLRKFLTGLRKVLQLERFVLKGQVMTTHKLLERMYQIGSDGGKIWYPTGNLKVGESEEDWHTGLMADIENFVTGRETMYPHGKLKEIKKVIGGVGDSDFED